MKSIDLLGRTFGKLTVISRYNGPKTDELPKRRGALWVCQCQCGNTKIKGYGDLVQAGDESCGCQRYLLKSHSNKWCGYEEISGEYWGRVKANAVKRNLILDIPIEYAWEVFILQNRKCKLSGMDISFAPSRRAAGDGTASIDRIDSNKGYIKDNIQWLHKDINRLKDHFSDERLKELCAMVYLHNRKHISLQ